MNSERNISCMNCKWRFFFYLAVEKVEFDWRELHQHWAWQSHKLPFSGSNRLTIISYNLRLSPQRFGDTNFSSEYKPFRSPRPFLRNAIISIFSKVIQHRSFEAISMARSWLELNSKEIIETSPIYHRKSFSLLRLEIKNKLEIFSIESEIVQRENVLS